MIDEEEGLKFSMQNAAALQKRVSKYRQNATVAVIHKSEMSDAVSSGETSAH